MDNKFIFDLQRFTLAGQGTASSPYIIKTFADLQEVSANVSGNNSRYGDDYYKLDADIDCNGQTLSSIGTKENPFKGNFDGNGHTISNLTLAEANNEGLFGYVDGATIKNVTVSNLTTTPSTQKTVQTIGGIAGHAKNGKFENCTVESGNIKGSSYCILGGIVGSVEVDDASIERGTASALIKNCKVNSGVKISSEGSSYNKVGGIVGNVSVNSNQPCTSTSDFSLTNCECLAEFEKKDSIYAGGGLVGVLYEKDLRDAQNLPVYYHIGIHNSLFDGSGYNETNFASVIGFPSFTRGDMSKLGLQGSRLRLTNNYYCSESGNDLKTAVSCFNGDNFTIPTESNATHVYKLEVPEGVTLTNISGVIKDDTGYNPRICEGNYYAEAGAEVKFKVSTADTHIIYGELTADTTNFSYDSSGGYYTVTFNPQTVGEETLPVGDVTLGATLRQIKGDGWSYDTNTKKLSITKNLDDFTSGNSAWYVWCDDITSVELGSDVTKIPAYAFQNCSKINTITVNGNISSIGNGAFDGTQYRTFTLPTSGITLSTANNGDSFSVASSGNTTYYVKKNAQVTLTLTADYLSGKNAVDVKALEYGQYGSIKINSRTYNDDTTTSITFTMPDSNLTEGTLNFAPVIEGLTFNSAGRYYEINDAQDLVDLANYIAKSKDSFGYGTTGGEYLTFKMTANINMSSVTNFNGIGTINHYPIAMGEGNAFRGTFDGDGHKITGLNINNNSAGSSNPNYAGLFNWVSEYSGLHGRSQAVIKNLTVVDPTITGGNAVGGIAGYVGTNVLIENCQVIGGTLTGNYKSSANRGFSTYSSSLGGIAGDCVSVSSKYDAAKIKNCTVINPTFTGGNKGALTGRGGYFIAPNTYYLADKSINFVGGGFAGGEGGGSTPLYKFTDVADDGITLSNISCADSTKVVTINGETYYKNGAVITFTYTKTGANELVPSVNGQVITNSVTIDKADVEVKAVMQLKGDGSENNPYLIESADGLKFFAESVNTGNSYEGKYIKLNNDITFNDNTFPPIGIDNDHTFNGNFDGNGKTIAATITKSGSDYVSLFGKNNGTIENLNVNATFQSDIAPAGGICDNNYGTIKNVKLSGSITSTNDLECGICGTNYGTIEGCVVDTTNRPTNAIAYNNINGGNIENCINATNYKSVSRNYATVTNVYKTNSACELTLPTDTNIKVNDGVTPTTYSNSGITAYEGGGVLYGGKLYLEKGEKVKLTTDANRKIFGDVTLDADGYFTPTGNVDLSTLQALQVSGEGWNVTFDENLNATLNITSDTAMTDYTSTNPAWYDLRDKIKTVNVADGVTSIGASAFKNLTALKTVTLANSVISIGASAFSGCSNITKFTCGNISTVGDGAFTGSPIKIVTINSDHTEFVSGALFTIDKTAYVLGSELVYRYTDGFTKGTSFNAGGATVSTNETNEVVTLKSITGDITVTDNPVALQGDEGDIGTGLTWRVDTLSDNTKRLVIIGDGAIKDFDDANTRPEKFISNLSSIKKVYIGPGVTHIGSNIFAGMTLDQVTIATKYYSGSTYEVAPTYSQVSIADNSGARIYRVDLPTNAFVKTDTNTNTGYTVLSKFETESSTSWYIQAKQTPPTIQILTPIGYNLVDSSNTPISRTLTLNSAMQNVTGTSTKIWTGTGTETDPFLIKTQADLQLLAATSPESQGFNSFNGYYFRLENDINWNVSIPYFEGTFDGNGHTVKATGSLFANNNGTIKNLTISSDSTNANFVNVNGGTIENCTNNSVIDKSESDNIGGIVNTNNSYGDIKNCKNTGAITGNVNVGGIAGVNNSGKIETCENSGVISGTTKVGGIVGNIQSGGTGAINKNFNSGSVNATSSSFVGAIAGRTDEEHYLYNNYYGGTGSVKGVGEENSAVGKDIGSRATKGYKLIFTVPDTAGVEVTLNEYIGVNESFSPNVTKGYKATSLSSTDDATFTKNDTEGKYILATEPNDAIINVTATVDLDAVNLTSANPTAEIPSGSTKTIRVDNQNKLNFVSSNGSTNVELQDGNLKITGSGIDIPAAKNPTVSNLNVVKSRADVKGTDDAENVTVSNLTLQGSLNYDSDTHAAYLMSSYSDISLNDGADTVTVKDTGIVGGDLQIDGGKGADHIIAKNITVSSVTHEGTDADNKPKTFAGGGVLNVYGDEGNDVLEIENVKYNVTDDEQSEKKIGGGAGNDSISINNLTVEGFTKLTIDGGDGDDTISINNLTVNDNATVQIQGDSGNDLINVGSVSGSAIVTIDSGFGNDSISVGGGNVYVISNNDNEIDNITVSGTGATVEAGVEDIVTVVKNSTAIIKYGDKIATVTTNENSNDAVIEFKGEDIILSNNFDGVVSGNITDKNRRTLTAPKTEVRNGVFNSIYQLTAANSTVSVDPSSDPFSVEVLDNDQNIIASAKNITLDNSPTTIKAVFDSTNYQNLEFNGGVIQIAESPADSLKVAFKDSAKLSISTNISLGNNITLDSANLNFNGSNDADSVTISTHFNNATLNAKLYDGDNQISLVGVSAENNSYLDIQGGANADNVTIDNVTLDSSQINLELYEGDDDVAINNISVSGGTVQLRGDVGNDNVNFDNVTLKSSNLNIFANEGVDTVSFKNVTLLDTTSAYFADAETVSVENVYLNSGVIQIVGSTVEGGKISFDNFTQNQDASVYLYGNSSNNTISVKNSTLNGGYFGALLQTVGAVTFDNVSLNGADLQAYAFGSSGNDTFSVNHSSGDSSIMIYDPNVGDDQIVVQNSSNVFVHGGTGADSITIGGGSTVDADLDDQIVITDNAHVFLYNLEGNVSTSAQSTLEGGAIKITDGWSGTIDGNLIIDISNAKTFTLNNKTYSYNAAKGVLTYSENGKTFMLNAKVPSLLYSADITNAAADDWRNAIFVENKLIKPASTLNEESYFIDKNNFTVYGKFTVNNGKYRLEDVGTKAYNLTLDLSDFNKEISIQVAKWDENNNLSYTAIGDSTFKTKDVTFALLGMDDADKLTDITISSDGTLSNNGSYLISAGDKVNVAEGAWVDFLSDGSNNKTLSINGKSFTTNSQLCIDTTNYNVVHGYAVVNAGETLTDYNGKIFSVTGNGDVIAFFTIDKDALVTAFANGETVNDYYSFSKVMGIYGLSDGASVSYDNQTYRRSANDFIVNENVVYQLDTVDQWTDALNLPDDSKFDYVKITDTIDLTNVTTQKIYGKDNYSADTFIAKFVPVVEQSTDESSGESAAPTKFNLTKGGGATSQYNVLGVPNVELTTDLDALITIPKGATINSQSYEGENLIVKTSNSTPTLYSGTITITTSRDGVTLGDNSDGVTITASNGILTAITGLDDSVTYNGVTYINQNNFVLVDNVAYGIDANTNILDLPNSALFAVNGVSSVDGLSVSDKVVTVAAASLNQNEVTISEGYELKLADDVAKPTEQNPAWYLDGTTATYKSQITAGYSVSDNKISYSAETFTDDLIKVSGVSSTDGLSVSNNVVTVATASLNQNEVTISEGYTLQLADDVAKPTTKNPAWYLDGTTATFKSQITAGYVVKDNKISYVAETFTDDLIKVEGVSSTEGLSFDSSTNILTANLNAPFTVNNVTYSPKSTLQIDTANNAVINGTVIVTDDQFGVNVSDDSNGVFVTFTDREISSITNLDDGGTVKYNGKTYRRDGSNVFEGPSTFINVTDDSDILHLTDGTSKVFLDDFTIDLRGLANLAYFNKNGVDVATLKDGALTISDSNQYTVLTDKQISINNSTYTPAEGTLTISANNDSSYLIEGAISFSGDLNLANDKVFNSSSNISVTVDKDSIKNISQPQNNFAALYGSSNDDTINILDSTLNGDLNVYGDSGDDSISVSNVTVNGAFNVHGDSGDDSINVYGNIFVDGGDDSDFITVGGGATVIADDNQDIISISDLAVLTDNDKSVSIHGAATFQNGNIAFSSDGSVTGDLAFFGYNSLVNTLVYSNGKLAKICLDLSPTSPSVSLPSNSTLYQINVRNSDGEIVKSYDNLYLNDDSTFNANFSNGSFVNLQLNGQFYLDADDISTGDIKITYGNLHLYSGKVSAENIIVQSESAGAALQINGSYNADEISIGNLTVSGGNNYAYIYGNEGDDKISLDGASIDANGAKVLINAQGGNDLISAANISGNGILTIDGGLGDDTISVDDSTNIFVDGKGGSDTVIISGAPILSSGTDNTGKEYKFPSGSSPKNLSMSADLAELRALSAATVKADSLDDVIVKENGAAYIIYGDNTFTVQSSKGDIHFNGGAFQITDGWEGEIGGDAQIALSDGEFKLNGTTFNYDAAEKVLSYVNSDGTKRAYTGDLDNLTPSNFIDDDLTWEDKLNEIICADGVIKLEGVTENSYFIDADGNKLATLKDNYLTKNSDVKQIDTTGYGKAVTIDYSFKNIPIKTVDGTFTVSGIILVEGQTESITVDAEGKVSDATTGLLRYTLTSGGINIFANAPVNLNGEGTVNGAKFTTTNGTIRSIENSAYAYIGTFTVTDSLNYLSSGVMTVENDNDGVTVTKNIGSATITGLDDGGSVTYGGKTYTRHGDKVFVDGKAYDCDNSTNILALTGGAPCVTVTDSIDLSKISDDTIFVDAKNNIVATYQNKILNVTGDVSSISGLADGAQVIYKGVTYTRHGNFIFSGATVFDYIDDTNILALTDGKPYVEVSDSIDLTNVEGDMNFIKDGVIVATYDHANKTLAVNGDVTVKTFGNLNINGTSYISNGELEISASKDSSSVINGTITVTDSSIVNNDSDGVQITYQNGAVTSITGLDDGGTLTFGGKTYTRHGDQIFTDNEIFSVDDSTNILDLTGGAAYKNISNVIDLNNINSDINFYKDGVIVAAYNHAEKVLTISGEGEYTVKTSNEISIGNTKYSPIGEIEIKADKDSSGVINGKITVTDSSIVTNDNDGVEITYKNGEIVSVTGLDDGATLNLGGKTLTRNADKVFIDGKQFTITDNTNLYNIISGKISSIITNNTIDLNNAYDGESFTLNDKVVATLEIDAADKYILAKGATTISGLIINAGDVKNIVTDLNATVYSNGSITVNDKPFTSNDALTLQLTKYTATLIDGTVSVSDFVKTSKGAIVKVSGDADGVTVNVEGGIVKSITGLNVGGTVTYNGATYELTEDNLTVEIANENKVYEDVDDSTNLLDLYTPYQTVTLSNVKTIDLRNLKTDHVYFVSKKKMKVNVKKTNSKYKTVSTNKIATLEGDELTISRVNDYKITAPKGSWTIDGKTYNALDDITVKVNMNVSSTGFYVSESSYLYSGTVNLTAKSILLYYDNPVLYDESDGVQVTASSGKATSIKGLSDGGSVRYSGTTYTRNGNYYSNGTKTYKGDDSTDLLNLDGLTEVVLIEDSLTLDDANRIANGTIIVQNGVEIAQVQVDASGTYTLTKINGYGGTLQINTNKVKNITTDFDAQITIDGFTAFNGVTVNGKKYSAAATEGMTLNIEGGEVSVYNGYIKMGDTLTTSDGKTYTKTNGTAFVRVTNGVVTEIELSGTINGDFTEEVIVNGEKLQVANDNYISVTAQSDNNFGVYEIGNVSDGAEIVSSAKAARISTDGGGEYLIGGETFNITNSATFYMAASDGKNYNALNGGIKVTDIIGLSGTVTSTQKDFYICGKQIKTNRDDLIFTTDGENITEIKGLQDGDSISGDLSETWIEIPQGTVTINGVKHELAKDSDGARVKGNVIEELDGGGELKIDAAGVYQVNGMTLSVEANAAIYGVLNGATTEEPINFEGVEQVELKAGANIVVQDTGGKPVELVSPQYNDAAPAMKMTVITDDPFVMQIKENGKAIWQNGTGTKDAGGKVEVENYNPENGSGIQTTQEDTNDLLDKMANCEIKMDDFTFTNTAGGQTVFKVNTGSSGDMVGDRLGLENAMRLNLYTRDGVMNVLAATGKTGGNIDATNLNSSLIMQGNYHGENEGGSNLLGGNGTNNMLAGAGDNLYLGAGKNNVYLNGGGGANIFAYDTPININGPTTVTVSEGESIFNSSGRTYRETGDNTTISGGADLAEDIGESADSAGKVYRSIINGFKFGYKNNADILNVSGSSFKISKFKYWKASSSDLASSSDMVIKKLNIRKLRRTSDGVIYNNKLQIKLGGSSGDVAASSDLGNVDYTKLLVGYEDGTVKTAIAGEGAVINLDWDKDERAEEYIGDNSGVDVGEFDGTVTINLDTGEGLLNDDEEIALEGVNKLKAGAGTAMFVGSSDAPNTLMAGSGDSSIWGGGESNDLLVGYSGEDKAGVTTFFYINGDGRDTINNFCFMTGDNAYRADKINLLDSQIIDVRLDGADVLMMLGDQDVLRLKDALGKDFIAMNNTSTVTAQVGTDSLTYDGRANYLQALNKNATVKVDSELYNAEVWLNGAVGPYFAGDIRVLDAAQVEGQTTLVGNDYDNVIIAGKGNSSMWGGNSSSSNDTLIGGTGADMFFYAYGNGKDTISGATADDTVNLFNVNLEQISGVEVNTSAVKINFKDYGSLTINGDTSGLTYRLGDGSKYVVDQSARVWTKK